MRLTQVVASIAAVCLVTGLIIYGGIFLWPEMVGSTPLAAQKGEALPRYLYSIGGVSDTARPNAVTVSNGRVYVTDGASGRVVVYTERGRKLFDFGKTGNKKKDLAFPNGIAVTREGNLLISDSVKNEIKVFSRAGKHLRTLPVPEKTRPGIIVKGPDELFYVSDLLNNRILVMDEKGLVKRTVSDPGSPLSYPQGTAIDRQGRLWVADGGSYAVKIFNDKGKVTKEIRGGGSPDIPFSMVRGIGFDRKGRAYITDTLAHKIRVFLADGSQLSVSSSSGQGEELVFPTNVFVKSDGKLFVVDRGAGNLKVYATE